MTHDQDPLQRAIAFKANTRHSCLALDRSTASTKQADGGAGARSHDAVVMIENIMRHIEAGEPPLKAALIGLLLQGAASPAGLLQCINLRSGESQTGQTRLFDNVDAMSAAPSIAAECCSAVFGASGHQLQKGAVHSITIVGAGKQFWADRSSLKSEFNLTCHKAHLRLPS